MDTERLAPLGLFFDYLPTTFGWTTDQILDTPISLLHYYLELAIYKEAMEYYYLRLQLELRVI